MTQFGQFHDFCRDSTLPICNLFPITDKSCPLIGYEHNGKHVANLGSIIFAGIAILTTLYLIWRSERKQAAVGRREMQLFLVGYILISICEIFSVGGFLTNHDTLVWFSAIHIATITMTCWILLLNSIVGYQLLDDGTLVSIGLFVISSLILFIGTGYIALDTAFGWTNEFKPDPATLKNYALYVLYLLFPLILLVAYFILETILVLRVLGESRPMYLLGGAVLLFAIGQIFDFIISVHLCHAASGKIDGSMFETLFNLLAVVMLWAFWSSITEDTWLDEEPLNPAMSESGYDARQSTLRPYDNSYA